MIQEYRSSMPNHVVDMAVHAVQVGLDNTASNDEEVVRLALAVAMPVILTSLAKRIDNIDDHGGESDEWERGIASASALVRHAADGWRR